MKNLLFVLTLLLSLGAAAQSNPNKTNPGFEALFDSTGSFYIDNIGRYNLVLHVPLTAAVKEKVDKWLSDINTEAKTNAGVLLVNYDKDYNRTEVAYKNKPSDKWVEVPKK